MTGQRSKPVIFLAFANSSANPLPHLAEECRRLTDILEDAEQRGICELLVRPFATVDQVLDAFEQPEYQGRIAVFHYAGHADSYRLLLEGADGAPALAHADGLAAFLAHQEQLQLVFLNGCSTLAQVQGLLEAGVNVVIATNQAINDRVATDFAVRFYAVLAKLDSIQAAYEKAQAAVQTVHGSDTRDLFPLNAPAAVSTEDWPWNLYERREAIQAANWYLSDTVMHDRLPFEPQTVLISAGPFLMGSKACESIPAYETPQHTVELPAYRVGKYPVTNRQYAEYVRETRASVAPEMGWQLAAVGQAAPPDREDSPVIGINWDEALAFCGWLSARSDRRYRLPTEAEWEKARNLKVVEGSDWEWTQTIWGRAATTPEYSYPYRADDGREQITASSGPYREYRLCRRICLAGQANRRRALADSRDRMRGFRVVMEI